MYHSYRHSHLVFRSYGKYYCIQIGAKEDMQWARLWRVGRWEMGGRAGTWHLCQRPAPFPGIPPQSQVAWICATDFGGMDLCRPTWGKGRILVQQQQPRTCTDCSTGISSPVQVRIALFHLWIFCKCFGIYSGGDCWSVSILHTYTDHLACKGMHVFARRRLYVLI